MKIIKKISLICFNVIILTSIKATPVAWDSEHNKSDWLNQESKHFSVTFRSEQKQDVSKVLNIAEQVHEELTPFFQSSPEMKTEIVLVDDYDYSNGWATALPYPQIRVIMQPPIELNDLIAIGDWLPSLIRHEYTHILHMEMANGPVKSARKLLGRSPVLFPHIYTPPMFLEGLAVYLETDKKLGYGRLHSSLYDMIMRMEIAENTVKDFSQVTAISKQAPLGLHYYYGSYFIEFLVDSYGKTKMQEFLQRQSNSLTPYMFINTNAIGTFGKDFDSLWADFKLYLKKMYGPQISYLQNNLVTGQEISQSPSKQIMTSSEQGLIIRKSDGKSKPSLVMVNKNGLVNKSLANTIDVRAMDYHQNSGLLVSRNIMYKSGVDYADLYLLKNNTWQRLTNKQRYVNARWFSNGQDIIASRNLNGKSELWKLNNQGESKELIWRGSDNEALGDFVICPDGQCIIASLKRSQHSWDLEKLDLVSKNWRKLMDTKEIEFSPSFMPNGELLFSADYENVFNIYSLNMQTHEISQLTSELGGAFAPIWQPNMGLVYQAYHHDGYKTKVIAAPRVIKTINLDAKISSYLYPKIGESKVAVSDVRSYSPFKTLKPQSFTPRFYADQTGVYTGLGLSGQDALDRHRYNVVVDYNEDSNLFQYGVMYSYDNRWIMALERSFSNLFAENIHRKNDQISILRRNLFPVLEDTVSFSMGSSWRRYAATYFSDESKELLVGSAVNYDNQQPIINLPTRGIGAQSDFMAEYSTNLQGKNSGMAYQYRLKNNWALPYYSVLSADLSLGRADEAIQGFELGGYGFARSSVFGNRIIALPGYNDASLKGHKYYKTTIGVSTLLSRIERNYSVWPFGIGDVGTRFYSNLGSAWDGHDRRNMKPKASVGVELDTELKLSYSGRINLATGFAKGFDRYAGGRNTFYANITQAL